MVLTKSQKKAQVTKIINKEEKRKRGKEEKRKRGKEEKRKKKTKGKSIPAALKCHVYISRSETRNTSLLSKDEDQPTTQYHFSLK